MTNDYLTIKIKELKGENTNFRKLVWVQQSLKRRLEIGIKQIVNNLGVQEELRQVRLAELEIEENKYEIEIFTDSSILENVDSVIQTLAHKKCIRKDDPTLQRIEKEVEALTNTHKDYENALKVLNTYIEAFEKEATIEETTEKDISE